MGSQFFCGGGSFEIGIDIEDEEILNDFTTCLVVDAGLPVGSFDELEVCYTAFVTNGQFDGCSASANGVGGLLGGGTCDCSICDNGISVNIDCSVIDIGIGTLSVPGPVVDFCALPNFQPAM